MKRILLFPLLIFCLNVQSQTITELWKPILKHSELAVYFSGMWNKLGISVPSYKEKLTVVHKGDHFKLIPGADKDSVDYLVELKAENIENMAKHGADGKIDTYESYRIMATLFTPFVRSALSHPMMNKSLQLRLASIEDHMHVYLESPTNEEVTTHTLLFVNKQWIVADGIHGEALREFHITPEDAIRYQKAAFKAQKEDTRKSWRKFKKFYLDWREDVSREK